MKPQWSTAPEWANYIAQDKNGVWHWFEREPHRGPREWFKKYGSYMLEASFNWEHSLEEKPKNDTAS